MTVIKRRVPQPEPVEPDAQAVVICSSLICPTNLADLDELVPPLVAG
jgi:hypothetical protein